MNELKDFKDEIKKENIKTLIKIARYMRKFLAALDAEIQARKGPSK